MEDFIKPWYSDFSEKAIGYVMRITVVVFGVIAIGLVFVVQHLGQVLQLSMSLSGATLGKNFQTFFRVENNLNETVMLSRFFTFAGPLLGLYAMGLFIPWVNAKSALIGAYSGLTAMLYIVVKAQADLNSGALTFPTKPTSTDGCTYSFNISSVINSTTPTEDLYPTSSNNEFSKPIHHISYLYYTLTGVLITIIVSLCGTLVIGRQDPKTVPSQLLAPMIRKLINVDSKADIANLPLSPSGVSCTTYNFEQEKLTEINKNNENDVKVGLM